MIVAGTPAHGERPAAVEGGAFTTVRPLDHWEVSAGWAGIFGWGLWEALELAPRRLWGLRGFWAPFVVAVVVSG